MFSPSINYNINNYNNLPIVETVVSSYGNTSIGGTFLDFDKYFDFFKIKNKSAKEEILDIFENEVFFNDDDNAAALEEIKTLQIEKKGNIFSYYDL